MSWQSYVDDHLLVELPGGGQLTHAAILGEDGGVWAQSPEFPTVSEAQVSSINQVSVQLFWQCSTSSLHCSGCI